MRNYDGSNEDADDDDDNDDDDEGDEGDVGDDDERWEYTTERLRCRQRNEK